MSEHKQHILVTGNNGFVGSNLTESMIPKAAIIGLDLVKSKNQKITSYLWNDLENVHGFDSIIHLAGKAHDTSNTTTEQEYYDVNLKLTIRIFEHFLKSKANKIIFFSSVKAIADTLDNKILSENETPLPITPYGKSKLAAEQFILSQPIPDDKKLYILRPVMIHGPGNKGNLNLLYSFVKSGAPYPLRAFNNERSFLGIDNLIYIIKRILSDDIEPGVYNVSDDEPMSTNDLIELMYFSMGRRNRILAIPRSIIQTIARAGDLFHLPINSERLKKLTESYVVSNEKIKKALHIDKMPFTSGEQMMKTLRSFS